MVHTFIMGAIYSEENVDNMAIVPFSVVLVRFHPLRVLFGVCPGLEQQVNKTSGVKRSAQNRGRVGERTQHGIWGMGWVNKTIFNGS